MSHHQNIGQNHDIKIANKSIKKVAEVQIFGNESDKSNYIHEEIKSKLNSENTCSHSVQNLLSSCLSNNLRFKYTKL